MHRWSPTLALALSLLGCADDAAAPRAAPGGPSQASPLTYQPDPEDTDCGVNCEPYSARSCDLPGGGTAAEVCDPSGLAYSKCGSTDWKPGPSLCAKGTKCVQRCPWCNLGCRAICEVKAPGSGEQACPGGLERVACQGPAERRAADLDCKPGDGDGVFCCPPGSPLLLPQ